jgi:hypothetical protein
MQKRTSPKKKALQIARYLREESPDYGYLRTLFMHLRQILEVTVSSKPKNCHMFQLNMKYKNIMNPYGEAKTSKM